MTVLNYGPQYALVSREDNNSLILGWTMVGGHTDIAMHIQNAEPITDNIIFSVIYIYLLEVTKQQSTF